ncbi:linear amide C-N hydrolase [Agathobacter ruminis]|uniref:linear amide C-N hydrolase n=1 Tax=Agathobacter ruminis TaxID=1712665 RepID=UPI00269288B7|nr:linear amide C-N hydrolase [Agathobacter ruminis]
MCTAITYSTKDHYFGRNLDLEFSYREEVTITPRNYPFEGIRESRRRYDKQSDI